jgi:hypothetical protein
VDGHYCRAHYRSPAHSVRPNARKTASPPAPPQRTGAGSERACLLYIDDALNISEMLLVSPLAILDGEGGRGGEAVSGELRRRGPPLCDPGAAHPTHLGGGTIRLRRKKTPLNSKL